jgi:hypothetical protein
LFISESRRMSSRSGNKGRFFRRASCPPLAEELLSKSAFSDWPKLTAGAVRLLAPLPGCGFGMVADPGWLAIARTPRATILARLRRARSQPGGLAGDGVWIW